MVEFSKLQTPEYWENRALVHKNTIENETDEHKKLKTIKKSETMKLVHSQRTEERKKEINTKISETIINSEKAKSQRIRRAKMGAKALNDYRESLTAEQLQEFNKKFGRKGISEYDKELFKEYYNLVWFYTKRNLKLVKT